MPTLCELRVSEASLYKRGDRRVLEDGLCRRQNFLERLTAMVADERGGKIKEGNAGGDSNGDDGCGKLCQSTVAASR